MDHAGMGMGAVLDGEWESLCKLLTFDEPNFETDQFLSHSASSLITPSIHDGLTCDLLNSQNSFSQCTTSSYDQFPLQIPNYENYHLNECNSNLASPNDALLPTSFFSGNAAYDTLFASIYAHEDGSSSSQTSGAESQSNINMQSAPKRVLSTFHMETETEKNDGSSVMPPKKKARGQNKGKKIDDKNGSDEDDMITNGGSVSQSASADVSDEGSNLSQENSEGENSGSKEIEGVASKGKKRASRGAATDPQSLYARKRRERINERLKILQTLVPNGTKVDISTMLEEALHYVKFLQLQIRLLSSDDLWMYAPLAYNGVDISLYKRISPFLLP